MKIRNHSRIIAFALALVMILPLISIPAFAEEAPAADIEWSENFNAATVPSDALAGYPAGLEIVDGALSLEIKGVGEGYKLAQNQGNHYAITEVTVNGDTLTGKVTYNGAVYTVSGPINADSVAPGALVALDEATAEADGAEADTVKGFKIISTAYSDTWKSGGNIGVQAKVKNPAISGAVYDSAVITVDYFISSDANAARQLELRGFFNDMGEGGVGNNKNFDLAVINIQDDLAILEPHGDVGTKLYNGSQRVPLDQWFTLKFEINLKTAEFKAYLNGEYAFMADDNTFKGEYIDIPASSIGIGQISRGWNPTNGGGTVKMDNVAVTTVNDLWLDIDFDQYEGMTTADIRTGAYKDNFGGVTTLASGAAPAQKDGNNAIKHGFFADIAGTQYDVPYYGYTDVYKHFEGNANIESYDDSGDKGILTLKDGTTYEVTKASAENQALGFYGNFTGLDTTGDSQTFKLATGAYAAAMRMGGNNIDKSFSVKAPFVSYEDVEEIYIEVKYFIEPNSKGTTEIQFGALNNNGTVKGWVALYKIDLATGVFNRGGALPIGQWSTVGTKINLVTGAATYYIDAMEAGTADLEMTNIKIEKSVGAHVAGLSISKILKGTADLAGAVWVDDVKMGTTAIMPAEILYKNDFESMTVGAVPSSMTGFAAIGNTGTNIVDTYGSKSWKIDFERTGGTAVLNIDKNPKLSTPAISYADYENIVYEVDYFFPLDASGQIQNQITGSKATIGGVANKDLTWGDIYQISFGNGKAVLKFESGADEIDTDIKANTDLEDPGNNNTYTFSAGRWNTVSAVMNLKTGVYDMYVNGVLAIPDVQMYKGGVVTEIQIAANQIVSGGKINKVDGKGSVILDNVKITEGTAPTVEAEASSDALDFDAFKYSAGKAPLNNAEVTFTALPALLTYSAVAGDGALRLDMGAAASADAFWAMENSTKLLSKNVTYTAGEATATVDGVEYNVTDTDGVYTFVKEEKTYRLVRADYAEAAYNAANVGQAFQISHEKYSYENAEKVMLEANYFIEAGSTGVVESQFGSGWTCEQGVSGWVQLFTINMETGRFNNGTMYMNLGEWNNVKVIIDLASGDYDMYVNGVWAATENFGDAIADIDTATEGNQKGKVTNVSITKDWIIAKVQRNTDWDKGPYAGGLYIDDVKVTDEAATSTSTVDATKFLSDEACLAYIDGLLTAVPGASIRLTDPTGLRFGSKVDTNKLAHIQKMYGEVSMGTIIAPASYMTAAGAFTKEALNALEINGAKYLDVEYDGLYFSGDNSFDASNGKYLVGSIVNIKAGNIAREFAGAAYVEITIGETVYAVYADAQVRSVQNVATAALADQDAEWTAEQTDILNAYAAGNQPS